MRRTFKKVGVALGLGLLFGALFPSGVAFAQEADEIADLFTAIDTAWLLLAAFLVFFMQAGFAMLTAGFVRAKNVSNILMKNVIDASVGSVAYWAVGFGLAFGTTADFMGLDLFFITPSAEGGATGGSSYADAAAGRGIPLFAFWLFQWAFAATAATIVAGGLAGRTKFRAYLFYTVFITGFIYPIVSHWVWGGGWLAELGTSDNGFLDFAGSTVVHSTGAWAALVGAYLVGPRIGKYAADGSVRAIPGHSMSLAALGMLILWFGWYGFNPGSTLGLTGGGAALAAQVAINTTLAAGAGAVIAMAISQLRYGKWDPGLTFNGALAGLVAVTAPSGYVDPYAAVIIGVVGGAIVVFSVEFFDRIHIDDPVGAISVHGAAGVWGTLSVGLFATKTLVGGGADYGLFTGGGIEQLGAQIIGILAVFGWVGVTSLILFLTIKYTIGLRVTEQEELAGLDVEEHGIGAYPEFPTVVPGAAVETLGIQTVAPQPAPQPAPGSGPTHGAGD
ncbi:MAG: ammonium transporter [Dehalococcoidia bacterium]